MKIELIQIMIQILLTVLVQLYYFDLRKSGASLCIFISINVFIPKSMPLIHINESITTCKFTFSSSSSTASRTRSGPGLLALHLRLSVAMAYEISVAYSAFSSLVFCADSDSVSASSWWMCCCSSDFQSWVSCSLSPRRRVPSAWVCKVAASVSWYRALDSRWMLPASRRLVAACWRMLW